MKACLRVVLLQSLLVLSPLAQAQSSQPLISGWNLVGNNSPATIDPLALFGNATTPITGISNQITSVWKWDAINTKWMFFAPSYDASALATYALGKSYGVMTSIASGEGYWVNAKAPLTLTLPAGTQGQTPPLQSLVQGWNLVANNSAAALDPITLFGDKPMPVVGITDKITSVWKWDAANTRWMFFAPSYEPEALATYAAGKSYGVLTSIAPGEGYWVNAAASTTLELPPALVGVAASGGPIADGAVTLTCGDGSTRTTKTDANGAYAVGLANCAAPYVVSVTGKIADTQETLVSVQPSSIGSTDSSLTVNVTPLTHALAATVASSGDPLDLVSNFSNEKAQVTETAVNLRKAALKASLADTLTTAGIDPTKFDLVNTRFSADRSGLDKVLDNVKVEVKATGVHMTNVAGAKVDDMGDKPAVVADDFSASTVSFNKGTDFAAGLTKLPPALDDHGMGDKIREALEACFAQPAAQRGVFGAALGACQDVPVAGDYLHDGRNGSSEFDRFLTSAKYDNAKFENPEIIRYFNNDTATPDIRALIQFTLTRADGVVESFQTVGEKSTKTNGEKLLRGNQRPFRVLVTAVVTRTTQVATNGTSAWKVKSTYFSTGITVSFGFMEGGAGGSNIMSNWNSGRKVSYVKVTGPGLPAAGLFLNPTLKGCDSYFAIVSPGTSPGTATPTVCTAHFRLSSRAATSADTDNWATVFGTNPRFRSAKMSDAEIMGIKPQSAYKIEIWRVGNTSATPSHVFYERMRGRPVTMGELTNRSGEVDKVRWNTISDETIALIDPTSTTTFAGGPGSVFPLKWTNAHQAPPLYRFNVITRESSTDAFYQDSMNVPFSANSVGLSNPNQNGWPTTMKTTQSTGQNFFEGVARDRHGTQLSLQYIY